MILVGLTGSIGMGKSTVTRMFADEGAVTWNADEAVHRLYGKGGAAVFPVEAAFPGVAVDGAIDRDLLSKAVLRDAKKLRALEAIVHPLVAGDRLDFLRKAREAGADLAVLDIPLLYENSYEAGFDAVVVVSAPARVQRERVLARPGMTEEKFAAILGQQVPDDEKRARADYVVRTDQPLEATRADVRVIVEDLRRRFA